MQKKSLLVALFCGALCLTGCLKNEESASVVQVRNAKANELNSIATLNEAKAAAELIYANADATLKAAEAELKKAEAALVLAMAETEKVRAELLKTQVALQEIKVEEEGIELLKKAAELEILLAKVEVEQAKAEAAKQYWANELAQLIADAEVAAAENELELMKAEQAINDYVLTLEGAKADSAKVYAQKYFAAQNKLVELQAAELAARAASVLLENNAMATREYIHNEIDKKNDTIAANEARIEALKKYLDVDPETAKANLEEAWTEYNVAYNDYQAKAKVRLEAYKEYNTLETKMEADFNNKSYGRSGSKWYNDFKAPIQKLFKNVYKKGTVDVTVGDVTVTVGDVGGIRVPSKENKHETEFIPFWQNETKDDSFSRYPDKDVVRTDKSDYVELKTTTIVPATIYYDNIQAALDTVVAFEGRMAAREIAGLKKHFAKDTAKANKGIARMEKVLALHQAYVDARAANVEAAEEAYVTEVGKAKAFKKAKAQAWEDFQNYMVINYDASRKLFIDRHNADTTYQGAVRDTAATGTALEGLIAAFPDCVDNVAEAWDDFVEAEGAYNLAMAPSKSAEAEGLEEKMDEAAKRWDPDFNEAVVAGLTPTTDAGTVDGYLPTGEGETTLAKWYIKEIPTIKAGSAQDSLFTYNYNYEIAQQKYYIALENTIRYPEGTTEYSEQGGYKDQLEQAAKKRDDIKEALKTAVTGVEAKEDNAYRIYKNLLDGYNDLIKPEVIAEAEKDYNPRFNDNKIFKICTFPTEGNPKAEYQIIWHNDQNLQYDWTTGEWYRMVEGVKEVAGDAQAALLDAVFAYDILEMQTMYAFWGYNQAKSRFYQAYGALFQANINLMKALGAEIPSDIKTWEALAKYIDEHIEEYIDDEADALYEAYLAVVDDSDVPTAKAALKKAYSYNPDEIARLKLYEEGYGKGHRSNPVDNKWKNDAEADFGWLVSSFNVNYKATMICLDPVEGSQYKEGDVMPIAAFLGQYWDKELVHALGADPDNGGSTQVLVVKKKATIDYSASLQYKIEKAQKYVDVIAPKILAHEIKEVEDDLAEFEGEAEAMMAAVNEYKATEPGYKAWVEDRMAAQKAVNDALIDEFDAKEAVNEAKAEYEAAKAAADGKVYLYNPWKKKFDYVSIPKAIEYIEAENEEIEARKHQLELDLKYGKLTYQTIMQVLDETIQTLSADIEIWTAIANQYKAVMNAYLGIVEEEPVAEEPVDDEE